MSAQWLKTQEETAAKKSAWKTFLSEVHWVKSMFGKPVERLIGFITWTIIGVGGLFLINYLLPGAKDWVVEQLKKIIAFLTT